MFWAHEIRARKTFGPTKYPQRHDGTRPTRPTAARDRRNLADPTISHHNEICSSRHEQARLMRLRFERYVSAWWWEKYLSKCSFIKHTYSLRVNLFYYEHWADKRKYFYVYVTSDRIRSFCGTITFVAPLESCFWKSGELLRETSGKVNSMLPINNCSKNELHYEVGNFPKCLEKLFGTIICKNIFRQLFLVLLLVFWNLNAIFVLCCK